MNLRFAVLTLLTFGICPVLAIDWPLGKITLHTVDESEKAVPYVQLNAIISDVSKESSYKVIALLTDSNGETAILATNVIGEFSYSVRQLSGYYSFGGLFKFNTTSNGLWLPWNPTAEVLLRPIVNPIPMYARKVEARIAQPAQRYGYDFLAADWVAPQGKGRIADIFFELQGYANSVKDYDSTLVVTFTNSMDGIQSFAPVKGSEFRSPREAPLDGYRQRLEVRRARKPGQRSTEWADDTLTDKYYFFRIRTELDEKGSIKSALYGKIYGGFDFFGASTNGSFLTIKTYYLNPEPNSRNMEFDPSQNLFKNLSSLERVTAP